MAKDKLTEYDATAANNTVVGDVNLAENSALPSDMNNAVREVMSHQKEAFGLGTPLLVDQTNNRVGIGLAAPEQLLHLRNASGNCVAVVGQFGTGTKATITAASNQVEIKADSGTNDVMTFKTGSSERVRITSDGLIGIGTASPSLATASGSANGIEISGTVPAINLNAGSSDEFLIYGGASNANILVANNNPLRFIVGGSERMRLDSGGSFYLNTTTIPDTANNGGIAIQPTSFARAIVKIAHTDSNSRDLVRFFGNSSTTAAGVIRCNQTSTSYNTSSDYRLKQGVEDMTGAIDRVKALAPKRFQFIAYADTTVDGFLAHEAQAVVPEAVTGSHNEVDEDGNAVMQGIDQAKLVPLLTGALKEAIAKIETLETKVAALEGAS